MNASQFSLNFEKFSFFEIIIKLTTNESCILINIQNDIPTSPIDFASYKRYASDVIANSIREMTEIK